MIFTIFGVFYITKGTLVCSFSFVFIAITIQSSFKFILKMNEGKQKKVSEYEEIVTLVRSGWECKIIAMESSMTISPKITSGHILKKSESRDSNRYLYTYVHSSIFHNSSEVETTQTPIHK